MVTIDSTAQDFSSEMALDRHLTPLHTTLYDALNDVHDMANVSDESVAAMAPILHDIHMMHGERRLYEAMFKLTSTDCKPWFAYPGHMAAFAEALYVDPEANIRSIVAHAPNPTDALANVQLAALPYRYLPVASGNSSAPRLLQSWIM
jgi:hypothetical protein